MANRVRVEASVLYAASYWEGGILEGEKIDVDKFGSHPSYQMFPSSLRMLCAKMCAQEITATIQSPPGNNSNQAEPTRQ